MKKILHTIYTSLLLVGLVAFALTSCVDDELVKSDEVVEGVPITVTFNIGGIPTTDVTVNTRADDNSLSDLNNLVIFVFRQDGSLEHYVSSRPNNDITITNQGNGLCQVSFKTTSGMKDLIAVANTSQNTADGGFWELTEIQDAVTSGELTFDELKEALISLRSSLYESAAMQPIQIVSASQMMMAGWNTDVIFNTDGKVSNYGTDGDRFKNVIVKMDRTMAKITFKIVEKPKDENDKEINATFRPSSYRVYNIPTKSYLTNKVKKQTEGLFASSSGTGSESETATKYIHYASSIVPSASEGFYSFEFYMPENIQATKNISDYNDRDKWNVETDGASTSTSGASPENKEWENAPQNSTFVVISGTYSGTDTYGKAYTGNVSYTIHLGDFSDETGSLGNFSVERNSSYTYKITVKGVDKIIAEAKKEKDKYQHGAEGQIFTYDASTYSYELDAHYEQVYLEYNLSQIAKAIESYQINGSNLGPYENQSDENINEAIANNLILVIQSPAMDYTETSGDYTVQNKRGTLKPYQIYADAIDGGATDDGESAKAEVLNGPDNTSSNLKGFDYKWIEFWPQSGTSLAKYPGVSEWSRENLTGFANSGAYGGDPTSESAHLKDVYDVIVAMGKVVKKIYKGESIQYNDATNSSNDYAEDGITIYKNGNDYLARFTAFVNEYYYYKHPLTGAKVTNWSVFTNTIPREMLIAMSSYISSDGNSTFSTVYSYISQLSMQTFYNADANLHGFGIETYNETPHIRFGTPKGSSGLNKTNGRANQLILLGGERNWETFIDYSYNGWLNSVVGERANHKLKVSAYKNTIEEIPSSGGAYFACLSRNRNLNGNDKIEDNEVRWYLASLNEYIRMGIGANAISNLAQLYMGDKTSMVRPSTYYDNWEQLKTDYSTGYPMEYIWDGALYYTSSGSDDRVYWATEKGSYSKDGQEWGGGSLAKPIRCIRALPATKDTCDISTSFVESDASYVPHNLPNNGDYQPSNPIVLEFRGRLADMLYRERVNDVLLPHHEDDLTNSFYDGIIVAKSYWNNCSLREIINIDGNSENPCAGYHESNDDGAVWRVPNLVELSAMNAAGLVTKTGTACCTQFRNQNVRFGFGYNGTQIYCFGDNTSVENLDSKFPVRCVRDVPADYPFPTN